MDTEVNDDATQAKLDVIHSDLSTISSQLATIEGYLSTINTNLGEVEGYGSLSSSSLQSIDEDLDLVHSALFSVTSAIAPTEFYTVAGVKSGYVYDYSVQSSYTSGDVVVSILLGLSLLLQVFRVIVSSSRGLNV